MKTDFKLLLSKLSENDFDFIDIGGFAAAAYGSSFVTSDLNICVILKKRLNSFKIPSPI